MLKFLLCSKTNLLLFFKTTVFYSVTIQLFNCHCHWLTVNIFAAHYYSQPKPLAPPSSGTSHPHERLCGLLLPGWEFCSHLGAFCCAAYAVCTVVVCYSSSSGTSHLNEHLCVPLYSGSLCLGAVLCVIFSAVVCYSSSSGDLLYFSLPPIVHMDSSGLQWTPLDSTQNYCVWKGLPMVRI